MCAEVLRFACVEASRFARAEVLRFACAEVLRFARADVSRATRLAGTWFSGSRAPESGLDGRIPRAFDEDSTCACWRGAPGTFVNVPRMPSTSRFAPTQAPTHLAAVSTWAC